MLAKYQDIWEVFMNELLKIDVNEKGEQLISARDLHEFLESKQNFADWIKSRIEKYSFIEDEDFIIILGKSTGGRPQKEYILKLDMAKEISMIENNEKGRMARKYFIECEKKLKGDILTSDPSLNRMLQNLQEAAFLRQQIDTMEKEFKAKMSLVNIEMISYYG